MRSVTLDGSRLQNVTMPSVVVVNSTPDDIQEPASLTRTDVTSALAKTRCRMNQPHGLMAETERHSLSAVRVTSGLVTFRPASRTCRPPRNTSPTGRACQYSPAPTQCPEGASLSRAYVPSVLTLATAVPAFWLA